MIHAEHSRPSGESRDQRASPYRGFRRSYRAFNGAKIRNAIAKTKEFHDCP